MSDFNFDPEQIPFPDLSEPEKLIAAYFSSPTVGLGILDTNFRYFAVNQTLAQMNGFPADEHIGKTLREILGPLADNIEVQLQKVLSTGEPVLNFEFSGHLPTRKEIGHWIDHLLPLKYAKNEVERIGCVVIEVSEQRKLERSVHDLTGKVQHGIARLQMLLEIGGVLDANQNVQEAFSWVSARVRRVLRQEFASLALHDANSGSLVRQALDFPLGKGIVAKIPTGENQSLASQALQARAPMIFSQDQIAGLDTELSRGMIAEGLRSLCCVPMLRPKGPLGVIVLGSTRENAFQLDDLSLLNQVAAQLALAIENSRAASEIEELKRHLADEFNLLEGEIRRDGPFAEIVGESAPLRQVLAQVATVAPSDANVLILGETGTGKELVARALHNMSRRSSRAFIKINCAAIPTGLLESELFGQDRGAFTGAISQKVGRMELADGGTLFLDEIGEISLDLQPKLLRVLQDQEFERLGSTRTIRVNIRIVAATNRDLVRNVAEHQFRADLFYRLNVFPIHLPPLRQRREDIPLLVRHLVQKLSQRMGRNIEVVPANIVQALTEWSWPGNVRELENLLERAVILSPGRVLRVPLGELHATPIDVALDHSLENAEREHILKVLRETRGVISGPDGAAHRLGLKRTTLQSKMEKLGIKRRDYLNPRD